MKGSVRNVELFLLLIFLIITVPLVYSLYNFQDQLAIDLGVDTAVIAEHTDVTILKLIGFFITEIFIGCAGIFLIFRELKKTTANDLSDVLDETIYYNKQKEKVIHQPTLEKLDTDEQSLLTQISNIPKKTSLKEYCNLVIGIISKQFEVSQGIFFLTTTEESKKFLYLIGGYAYYKPDDGETKFLFGEGLAGQVAKAQKIINIKNVPDGYIKIVSGLGSSTPKNLIIVPFVEKSQTIGVMELASFKTFSTKHEEILSSLSSIIVKELIIKIKESEKDKKQTPSEM